ncbi:MAG: SpoIIE family protein phosphatase [Bacteroidales bacterium]|nr:SpoIIE family protein phosphatase [Bacteroidales bacterium]
MKYLITLLILLLSQIKLFCYINKNGVPFVRNYDSKIFKVSSDIWAETQDKYGVLYFGNSEGDILRYDGREWHVIKTGKNMIIYSLKCDMINNVIYVGGAGDFGKLIIGKNGMQYISLARNIKTNINTDNFYKIYIDSKGIVYFCSFQHLFILENNKIKEVEIPGKITGYSFLLNDTLYIPHFEFGLLKYNNLKGSFDKTPISDVLKNKEIIVMFQALYSKEIVIFDNKDLYIYNYHEKTLKTLKDNFNISFLSQSIVYNVTTTSDGKYVWATVNNGVIISDVNFKIENVIGENEGLITNSVSNVLYSEIDGTIWATTPKGLSCIFYNSPISHFPASYFKNSDLRDITIFNNELYISTLNWLFKKTKDNSNKSIFIKVGDLRTIETIYSMQKNSKELLLISDYYGNIYEFDGKFLKKILNETYAKYFLQVNSNTIYAGSYRVVYKLQYDKQGKWTSKIIEKCKGHVKSMVLADNYLWISTLNNGIFKINILNDSVTHYTVKNGLPDNNNNCVFLYKNNVLVGTKNGLYRYEPKREIFLPTNLWNNVLSNVPIASLHNTYYNNEIIVISSNKLGIVKPFITKYVLDSITFRILPDVSVYERLFTDNYNVTWISTSDGLVTYNPKTKVSQKKYYCLIKQVKFVDYDSILFNGFWLQGGKLEPKQAEIPEIEYKYNKITFSFYAPFFHKEEEIKFSYFLEGFDSRWSDWNYDNKVTYNNLPEGKYTFKVKAKNIYNKESLVSTYSFEILPPWYRTLWAYISYVIIFFVIIITSTKLYTRKLEADKRKLEKIVAERTAEVVRQKEEIEQKNKIIEQKNKDILDSINYAKRIQDSILPPVDYLKIPGVDIFVYYKPKDIVSGDFYFIKYLKSANVYIVAAADCTGHGVPGAFMSMLGSSLLNEIINRPEITTTDMVLNELRERIINALNPEGKHTETRDGMDIALIAYFPDKRLLQFSGANNPLYLIRNDELIEYKADKMPVGLYDENTKIPFSRHEINIKSGDLVYIFSDGFADQFGGEHGKKYLYKNFKNLLLRIHKYPLNEQCKLIEEEGLKWRGDKYEQIDDNLIIGIKFS